MIERYIKHICRFNVYLDAIVEKCEVPTILAGKTLSGTPPVPTGSSRPAGGAGGQDKNRTTVLRLVSCRLKPL